LVLCDNCHESFHRSHLMNAKGRFVIRNGSSF
jgi:hypothetical protein